MLLTISFSLYKNNICRGGWNHWQKRTLLDGVGFTDESVAGLRCVLKQMEMILGVCLPTTRNCSTTSTLQWHSLNHMLTLSRQSARGILGRTCTWWWMFMSLVVLTSRLLFINYLLSSLAVYKFYTRLPPALVYDLKQIVRITKQPSNW